MCGTGTQALAFRSEDKQLFAGSAVEIRKALTPVEPHLLLVMDTLYGSVAGWSARAMLWLLPMVAAIPYKMAKIRAAGGEDAVRLARLLRQAAAWSVLMAGSVLILAAAVIQLVLALA